MENHEINQEETNDFLEENSAGLDAFNEIIGDVDEDEENWKGAPISACCNDNTTISGGFLICLNCKEVCNPK
jgi:hypothetical protein